MPSSTSGYGVYNPGGIDPFPIEQTLAQIVGTNNPAEAGNLLDVYRVQNQTASANYDYVMNQQHEYAKQQMAATLAENQLKAAMEGVKTPGGLTTAMAMDPAIRARLQGISGPIETNLQRAQDATTAEHGASAGYHAVQAGMPLPLEEFQRITGTQATPGVPLQLQIARENNAAHAATAGAHEKFIQMPVKTGMVVNGQPVVFNWPVAKGSTPEQVEQARQQALDWATKFYPQGSGLPNTVGTSGSTDAPMMSQPPLTRTGQQQQPTPTPKPAPNATNLQSKPPLPMAKPDTGRSSAPAPNAPFLRDRTSQTRAANGLRQLDPTQRKDIMNNMGPTGAEIPIVAAPGGGMVYVGRSKQQYPVPGG